MMDTAIRDAREADFDVILALDAAFGFRDIGQWPGGVARHVSMQIADADRR